MLHRHLDYPADTTPDELPSAAIVDILDRGDVHDWLPLIRAAARNPAGPLTERVAALVDAYPMYGTSMLWRAWLERCRIRAEPRPSVALADLRRRVGLTQAAVAERMGISQSDVSKLERRADLKVSTLSDYLAALGCQLRMVGVAGDADVELRLPIGSTYRPRAGSRRPAAPGRPLPSRRP